MKDVPANQKREALQKIIRDEDFKLIDTSIKGQ
jgi:hypothetical protein